MPQVIDVDMTPNPQALKFILNERLLKRERRSYKSFDEAANDPLALGLLKIDGVVSVFYMDKFITIEKRPDADWGKIQKELVAFVKNFDMNLIPREKEEEINIEQQSELLKRINEVLDLRVRPALAGDGGGLEVIGIDGYVVKIKYQGACGSCPSAITGTLMAIENLLRREVDPMIEVEPA